MTDEVVFKEGFEVSQALKMQKSEKQRKKLLVKLRDYLAKKNFKVALDLAKQLRSKYGDDKTSVPIIAEAYYQVKDFEHAEIYLKKAQIYSSSNGQLKENYQRLANIYNQRRLYTTELEYLNKGLEIDFTDNLLLERKGSALVKTGELQQALECFKQAIFFPVDNNRKSTADRAMAHWHLMTTPLMKPIPEEIEYLKRDLSLMKTDKDKSLLFFALGNGLERLEDYEGALQAFIQANLFASKTLIFDPEKLYARVASIADSWSGERDLNALDNCKFTPIFIVGLPRSGTTLTESVFDQHKDVMALGESPYLTKGIKKYVTAKRSNYEIEDEFLTLDKNTLENIKRVYIEENEIPEDFTGYTVDKMPGNFSNIGLLKRIFPNAIFINVFKNPVDACFSIFKQNFGRSQPHSYSYSLGSCVFFRRYYEKVIGLYKNQFDDSVFDLSYEAFMDEGEPAWQRMFEFCGLQWDSSYLDFYKSKRQVNTISAAQVRQKINKKSANRSDRYAEVLDPLRDLLKLSYTEIWHLYREEIDQLKGSSRGKLTVKSSLFAKKNPPDESLAKLS